MEALGLGSYGAPVHSFDSVLLLQMPGYSFLKPLAPGAVGVAKGARGQGPPTTKRKPPYEMAHARAK